MVAYLKYLNLSIPPIGDQPCMGFMDPLWFADPVLKNFGPKRTRTTAVGHVYSSCLCLCN